MGSKYGGYSNARSTSSKDHAPKIHPIWRGVGFGMMILIPIMAYAAMVVFQEQNNLHGWFTVTPDMLARPGEFLYSILPDPLLYVKIVLFLLFMFIFYMIFLLISTFITGMFGVSRKDDPFYVPPVRHTKAPPKNYRRR